MSKYLVKFEFIGDFEVEVEADSEDDAYSEGLDKALSDSDVMDKLEVLEYSVEKIK